MRIAPQLFQTPSQFIRNAVATESLQTRSSMVNVRDFFSPRSWTTHFNTLQSPPILAFFPPAILVLLNRLLQSFGNSFNNRRYPRNQWLCKTVLNSNLLSVFIDGLSEILERGGR